MIFIIYIILTILLVLLNILVINKRYNEYIKMRESWRNNNRIHPETTIAEPISIVQANYIENIPDNITVVEVEREVDVIESN